MKPCYLFFLVAALYSCEQPAPQTKSLDFFGEFENTEVTFILKGNIESINFSIDFFQFLNPRYLFDTTLVKEEESVRLTKRLSLEKPTILRIGINGNINEIFLLPAEPATLICSISSDGVKITFEEEPLQQINQYYARKAAVTGGLHRSNFYGPEMLKTSISLAQIFENLDSMKTLLSGLLQQSAEELDLPEWFVRYEDKNIYYRDKSTKASAPIVRAFRGISDPHIQTPAEIGQDFVLNDEDGLLSEDFLDLITAYIREGFDDMAYRKLSRDEQVWLRYKWGQNLSNQKIRDIYYAHNWLMLQQTSYVYADSLVHQFRQAVSADLQPHLLRLEQNFAVLEGKKAPAIHLKDANDQLVSLSDYKGNIILLDFWFIGCPGCREELPHDRKLVDTFKNAPFKLIKVCVKSDRTKWQHMQSELSGINLISNEAWDKKLAKAYQLKGYPRYVLIDKAGKIIDGWSERPSAPTLKDRLQTYFL